jgi:hypothetical protein
MSKRHLHSVIKRLQAEIDMQSNIEPCRFNIMCPKSTEENHCRLIMVVIPSGMSKVSEVETGTH